MKIAVVQSKSPRNSNVETTYPVNSMAGLLYPDRMTSPITDSNEDEGASEME